MGVFIATEGKAKVDIEYRCESLDTGCDHVIPAETFAALENWRAEHGDDGLYIVRSDCTEGFKIVQRYGSFCVIEDKQR